MGREPTSEEIEAATKALRDGSYGGPTEIMDTHLEVYPPDTWHISCHECEHIEFAAAARIALTAAYAVRDDALREAALRVINDDRGRHEQSIGQLLCHDCRRKWPCAMAQLRDALEGVIRDTHDEDEEP